MQTRSQARDVHGVDTLQEMQVNGASQAPPREQSPPHEQAPLNEEVMPHKQASPPTHVEPPPLGVPPQEAMIQLTQEALLALIRDASTRAAAQAIAQFAAQHPVNPPLLHLAEVENYPRLPRRRSRGRKGWTAESLNPKLLRHKNNTPLNRGNLLLPSLQREWMILI
ncbi:UNVERIFIED_CONTAM: hypothetical protein Sradi_6230800 [Sesamum radiatum]|uniref:Uncharacterized protein n=1 Tax=Sesamum radiatum TaxID=300843 RepID=A0AAW2KAW5_SESRA